MTSFDTEDQGGVAGRGRDDVLLALADAWSLLRQEAFEAAAERFSWVVETAPDCASGWLGLGQLALTVPDLEAALDFFSQAVALDASNPDALSRLGDVQRRSGLLDDAVHSFNSALALNPDDFLLACKLANTFVDAGELVKARDLLSSLLERFPAVAELYLLRGMTMWQLGSEKEAESDFRLCISLSPDNVEALAALGEVCREKGLLEEVGALIQRAAAINPTHPDVLKAQANLFLATKDWAAAVALFDQVLERNPRDLVVSLNRAVALVEMGQAVAAIDALEAALAVGASEPWVHEMVGLLFAHQGQWEVALENLESSVEREPRNTNALNALIVVYTKLGLMEKAEDAAEKVLEINPRHVSALINLAGLKIDLGHHDEAVELFRRALAEEPDNVVAYSGLMFGMLFSSRVGSPDLLEVGRAFDTHVCQPWRKHYDFSIRSREPDRPLRIGWVSSDLRAHAVGAFIAPFFSRLDSSRVECYVYDNYPKEDPITQSLKPFAKAWRNIRGHGDNAVAETIWADQIDILVDLNGYTAGHRLGVFARKPAPIQVEWLGYPGTTGILSMDYVLIPDDPFLERGAWCSEKPWRLANCYGVRGDIPAVAIKEGLPVDRNGYFTFACMNRYSKVSAAALDLWASLLARVENSRLILIGRGGADERTVAAIHARFEEKGVGPERLELFEALPVLEYFDTYNKADLCLDPFPFNGGTTGFDSIWMGVPFVSLRGEALHSRAGSNILKYVGLESFIADSEAAYIETAANLTRDLDALRAARQGLRERMLASPLMDAKGFARGLERVFRDMWRTWCDNRGKT